MKLTTSNTFCLYLIEKNDWGLGANERISDSK